ncbi:MAG: hypothetical protein HYY52_07180 [Candidatus Melainabacteria bacterium]|nr:hypothetical protein [Candidatus Melainabacteria bacterium]
MNLFFLILFSTLFNLFFYCSYARANQEQFYLCPLCTQDGLIVCPDGFEAACSDKSVNNAEPKCILLGQKYIAGCWEFIGIKKVDLNLFPANMPPSLMVNIIGGGETYTLNRETIGCKEIDN